MNLIDTQNNIFATLILMKNKVQHECRTSVDKRPKTAIFFVIFSISSFISHCFYTKALKKTGV